MSNIDFVNADVMQLPSTAKNLSYKVIFGCNRSLKKLAPGIVPFPYSYTEDKYFSTSAYE